MSNFDYAGPLTETVLLGCVAMPARNRIEWDGPNMKITNVAEANQFRREYRKGWELLDDRRRRVGPPYRRGANSIAPLALGMDTPLTSDAERTWQTTIRPSSALVSRWAKQRSTAQTATHDRHTCFERNHHTFQNPGDNQLAPR